MSTRASLIANPETKPKVLAESVGWIPLLWVPLMSSLDLARIADCPYVHVDRKEAIERFARATPFLATLFPEFDLSSVAEDFAGRLRRLKAKTIAIEFRDHFAMRPRSFSPASPLRSPQSRRKIRRPSSSARPFPRQTRSPAKV